MNVKMKRYLKALVAFVLAFAMVSEAWGGISFVSKAETSESEVNAVAETVDLTSVPEFPTKLEKEWALEELPTGDSYKLSSEDAFVSFARASRAHTFEGKVVYLNTDVIYTEDAFGGIGDIDTKKVSFQGTFDGQNHKISNMVVGSKGIFASIKGATIKNLVIDNATMSESGNARRGLLVSKAYNISGDPNINDRSIVIDGITITDSSMTANHAQSGLIVGYANNTFPIRNCTIENSTMNCTRTAVDDTAVSGYGLVVGYAVQKVNINKVKVVDSAINFNEKSWVSNVGGFVGYIGNGGSITNSSIKNSKETPVITGLFEQANEPNPNQKKDVVMGDATKGWLIDGLDPDKAKVSENIGGVIGYVGGVFNAKNVEVDNVDISMKNVLGNVGGFAGYVSFANTSEDETTFTNCHVKNANIVSTQFIWDPGYKKVNGEATTEELPTEEKHYYHNVAGLVACVDKKASFTECSVVDTVTQTQSRYRCGGGLIGSTFTYKKDADELPAKGILNVSKCFVERTVIKTGNSRNCNVGGGLIALLSEGSTVTDCYVYDYATTDNTNSLYMGGLIGDVYDIQKGSLKDGKTTVKNCYVGKAHLQGFNFVGEVIGDTDDGVNLKGFSNLLYCTTDTKITRNPNRDNPSIATFDAVKGKSHDKFVNRELAYTLNAGGSDGAAMTDVWMQGTEYPVFSDGSQKPIRKVVFQAEGQSFAYFTNAEGKLDEYPNPDDGYKWEGYELDTIKDVVFEKNTFINQILVKEELTITNYEQYMDKESDFHISTPEELNTFRELSKKYTFEGKTIHLMANIDMSGIAAANWNGIGNSTYPFGGTFDGHGYTISNLKSTNTGLFLMLGYNEANGVIAQPTVKNFTLENAQISGSNGIAIVVARFKGNPKNSTLNNQILNIHVVDSKISSPTSNTGVIAGRNDNEDGDAVTISGCTVTRTTVECTGTVYSKNNKNEDTDFTNYAFILARDISKGYSRIVGCTVTDSKIISKTCNVIQVGGIVGYTNGGTHIEDCSIVGTNSTVEENKVIFDCSPDASRQSQLLGGILGYANNFDTVVSDCTVTGVEIKTAGNAFRIGLVVGYLKGKTISGAKVSDSTINSTYEGETQSGLLGGIVGQIGTSDEKNPLPESIVTDCEVENITINLANNSYSVGGMIGRVSRYTQGVVKDSVTKDVKIKNTYATEEKPASYSFGGAIGHIQEVAVVKNVTVEGIQIDSTKAYRNSGGFVGMVQGAQPSVFENCKVTAYKKGDTTISSHIYENKEGKTFDDTDYSFNVGGFAGLVISDSEFSLCTVDTMDVYFRDRIRGFGGIVGTIYDLRKDIAQNSSANIYAEGKVEGTGIVTINRCASNNITISSGGASYFLGGIVGGLSEGSIVTNCLIDSFSHKSTGSNNVGAVVGRLYNTDTSDELEAILKNNYIQNCNIDVGATAGIVLGGCVGLRDGQNNYYYDTVLKVSTTDANNLGQQYNHSTEVNDASILTNKELAYNLNTTNGTEPNSGSWAQGATNPIIATEDIAPVVYVSYLRYNGTGGYKTMEYLRFPLAQDGSIDYTQGERYYINKVKLTSKDQIIRKDVGTGNDPQEEITTKIIERDDFVRESMVKDTTGTVAASEPETNDGRVWQYPEGEIRTDVTINQVPKTAWDYNGDTELTVSDLVRLKKSEKVNYNSNTCKASKIGDYILTNNAYGKKANNQYADNQGDIDGDGKQDITAEGHLPSYRLRRLILTPPSTEVSVLSYNLYYQSKTGIADADRYAAIMNTLGLSREANDEADGKMDDATEAKADIISLQEVSANYWHDTLYKNYLKPYTTTVNGNEQKKYYQFKHVGRGRYGHVFYNNLGKEFKGDSYTLILYNQEKYEYDLNEGFSGTFYLSDTPSVASWGFAGINQDANDTQRAANWAIFTNKKTGERFMFVSVHLSNSEEGVDRQEVRMKQIELLLRKIQETLGRVTGGAWANVNVSNGGMSGGMPVIIAGDFNAQFNYDAYTETLSYGYVDSRETATVSSEKHGAYNNWTQMDETKFAYGDHIFTSQNCKTLTYEVMNDEPSNMILGTDGTTKYYESDHFPIRATIDVGTDYIRSTTTQLNNVKYNEVYGYK